MSQLENTEYDSPEMVIPCLKNPVQPLPFPKVNDEEQRLFTDALLGSIRCDADSVQTPYGYISKAN